MRFGDIIGFGTHINIHNFCVEIAYKDCSRARGFEAELKLSYLRLKLKSLEELCHSLPPGLKPPIIHISGSN